MNSQGRGRVEYSLGHQGYCALWTRNYDGSSLACFLGGNWRGYTTQGRNFLQTKDDELLVGHHGHYKNTVKQNNTK